MPDQTERTHAISYWLADTARRAAREAERGLSIHGPHHSFHEAWAVLHEEHDELWDEIKSKTPDYDAIQVEAIQVAAMALRIAVMARRGRA